jgi:uncharacterized membrane protein YcaP (DUF421 family)
VWDDLFSLPLPAEEKILRAVLVYAFLVVVLRVIGKRELGQFNTLDLVVLLLVANAVQNGIIGADNSVTGAFIGAATLFVVNEALNRLTYAIPAVSSLVEGQPTVLIEAGKPVRRRLIATGISLPELRAIARRQGFRDLGEVSEALLETNGVVTMFGRDEAGTYHPAEPGGPRIGKRRRAG